jgi:hypothetical protein
MEFKDIWFLGVRPTFTHSKRLCTLVTLPLPIFFSSLSFLSFIFPFTFPHSLACPFLLSLRYIGSTYGRSRLFSWAKRPIVFSR